MIEEDLKFRVGDLFSVQRSWGKELATLVVLKDPNQYTFRAILEWTYYFIDGSMSKRSLAYTIKELEEMKKDPAFQYYPVISSIR